MNPVEFEYCDKLISEFEESVSNPIRGKSANYFTGVDLGTACIVLAVLDENKRPAAGAYRYADVVRDGMVVDYMGAVRHVKEMKIEIESKLGAALRCAAAAIPPGTEHLGASVVKNVAEAAGFEVNSILDEPTAANEVIGLRNGAIVDIGGGTTGISVLKDGKVVYVADEPTGGTHFSLVVAGAYKIPVDKAELLKRNKSNHRELYGVLKPVMEKVSSIVKRHICGYDVSEITLVGGMSCFTGIEEVIQEKTGISTRKPKNPLFVTPLGIALCCLA